PTVASAANHGGRRDGRFETRPLAAPAGVRWTRAAAGRGRLAQPQSEPRGTALAPDRQAGTRVRTAGAARARAAGDAGRPQGRAVRDERLGQLVRVLPRRAPRADE